MGWLRAKCCLFSVCKNKNNIKLEIRGYQTIRLINGGLSYLSALVTVELKFGISLRHTSLDTGLISVSEDFSERFGCDGDDDVVVAVTDGPFMGGRKEEKEGVEEEWEMAVFKGALEEDIIISLHSSFNIFCLIVPILSFAKGIDSVEELFEMLIWSFKAKLSFTFSSFIVNDEDAEDEDSEIFEDWCWWIKLALDSS